MPRRDNFTWIRPRLGEYLYMSMKRIAIRCTILHCYSRRVGSVITTEPYGVRNPVRNSQQEPAWVFVLWLARLRLGTCTATAESIPKYRSSMSVVVAVACSQTAEPPHVRARVLQETVRHRTATELVPPPLPISAALKLCLAHSASNAQ